MSAARRRPSASGSGGDIRSRYHDGRPARSDPVDRRVAQRVGEGVLGPRHVRCRPPLEAAQDPPGGLPERDELRVLDPPATGQLLDDEVRIEQQRHLPRPQLGRKRERPDDGGVLGDVVRLDAEILGDRGVRSRPRVAGVRSRQIDQDRAGRRRARVPAGGPVGSDQVIGQDDRSPPSEAAGAEAAGAEAAGAEERSPRSRRQNIWIGS